MAQLSDKPKVFRTNFTFEGSPVTLTLNPNLTIDLAVLRRPTTKFSINALYEYLDSKKMAGPHSSRKTFIVNDNKEIVPVLPAKTADVMVNPTLVIEECAPSEPAA